MVKKTEYLSWLSLNLLLVVHQKYEQTAPSFHIYISQEFIVRSDRHSRRPIKKKKWNLEEEINMA